MKDKKDLTMKEMKSRKKSKRFEPRMNANKRELKDFLLPRSSRRPRRKAKDGTTEITERHGRKYEIGWMGVNEFVWPYFAKATPNFA